MLLPLWHIPPGIARHPATASGSSIRQQQPAALVAEHFELTVVESQPKKHRTTWSIGLRATKRPSHNRQPLPIADNPVRRRARLRAANTVSANVAMPALTPSGKTMNVFVAGA